MSTPTVAPPPAPVGGLSEGARLFNVFFAPSKTFSDINRNASWWVPYVLTIAFVMFMQFMVVKVVGAQRLVENQFAKMPNITEKIDQSGPGKLDEFMAKQAASTQYSWITAALGPAIITLIVSLLLWGTYSFGAGQRVTWGQTMAVVSYAGLPGILKSLLTILVAYLTPETYNPLNPIATNLGYLLGDAGAFVRVLGSFVDIFAIWTLLLSAYGFTRVTKVKMGTSVAINVGWYLIFAFVVSGLLSLVVG